MDSTEVDPDCCSSVGAAARAGDSKSLQKLIANGSSINIHDNRGWTPLHEAAKANHSDCVRILLQRVEEDVDVRTLKRQNGLLFALQIGNKELMDHLLQHGANPNICDKRGALPLLEDVYVRTLKRETALLFAAQYGNKEMMEQLLQHGADPNICDKRGVLPINEAVDGNHKECVELLRKNYAHVTQFGWSSLHEAACRGFADIVRVLLESGVKTELTDDYGVAPLFVAALYGHLDCLKLLIEHGANPNKCKWDNSTPLYVATRENHPDCVEYLLEHGASVTISVSTKRFEMAPIHVAADKGHMRCLELLLPSLGMLQKEWYEESNTPMHFAARKGHIEVIKALLKAGCSPDFGLIELDKHVRNNFLGPPQPVSLCAMEERQFGVAKLLLDSGACVCNPQSGHCLVKDCKEDVPSLKFLLDYGADVGCPHMSVVKLPKNLKYASLLLKSGKRWSFDCSDGHGFCSQRWISYDTNRHMDGLT